MLAFFALLNRIAPALVAASAVAWGIGGNGRGWPIGIPLLAVAAIAGAAWRSHRHPVLLLAALLLLTAIGYGRRQYPAGLTARTSYRRLLPRPTCGVTLHLRILRAPVRLAALPPGREQAQAAIIALASHGQPRLQACRGRILLRLPAQPLPPAPERLHPGEIWECEGVLEPAAEAGSAWGHYGNYLRAQGISHTFSARRWQLLAEPSPHDLRHRLHRWRCWLGDTLATGMCSPDSTRLVLALGLGLTEYFPPELARRYIITGTLHIFAISGLHIGIIALLLEKFLRLLPLSLAQRRLPAALLLLLYLLLTGFSPSAVRATGMALLILYAGARHRPAAPLNALGLMLLATLLHRPEALLHSSLQYSYLVVFALLCGYPGWQAIMRVIRERELWVPRRLGRPPMLCRAGYALIQLSGTALLAWLASAGITMQVNGTLCLLSPLLNLPLGTAVTLVLALIPVKILAGALCPAAQPWLGCLLEGPLTVMRLCGEYAGAEAFELTTGPLAAPVLALYHLLLLLLLLSLHRLADSPPPPPEET